ncbi:hypothetical protein BC567DRAFT_274784 [Phyllosticta citribraziliensis]
MANSDDEDDTFFDVSEPPPRTPQREPGWWRNRWGEMGRRAMRPSQREQHTRLFHAMLSKEGDTRRAANSLRATIEATGQDDEGGVEELDRVEERDDLGSTWFGPALNAGPSNLQQWQIEQGASPPDPLTALFETYIQGGRNLIPVSEPGDQYVILGAERRRASRVVASSLVRGYLVLSLEEILGDDEMTLLDVHNVTVRDTQRGTNTTWLLIVLSSTAIPESQFIAIPSTFASRMTTTIDTETRLTNSVTVEGVLHAPPQPTADNTIQIREVVHSATTYLELTHGSVIPLTSPSINAPQMSRWRGVLAHCSLGDLAIAITSEAFEPSLDYRDVRDDDYVVDADGTMLRVEGAAAWEAARGRERDSGRGFGPAAAAAMAALGGRTQRLALSESGNQGAMLEEVHSGRGQGLGQRGGANDGIGYGRGYGNAYGRGGPNIPWGTGRGRGNNPGSGNAYGPAFASGSAYASRHGPGSDAARGQRGGRGRGQGRGGGRGAGSGFNTTARRAMERRR